MPNCLMSGRWSATALSTALVMWGSCCVITSAFGQNVLDPSSDSVSTEVFLSQLKKNSAPGTPSTRTYPLSGFPEPKPKSAPTGTSPASYSPTSDVAKEPGVASAEYSQPNQYNPANVVDPMASGPADFNPVPILPNPTFDIGTSKAAPPQEPIPSKIQNWLGLDRQLPNFLVGYEVSNLRNSNDAGGGYSSGPHLGKYGNDLAGRYTFARLYGTLDQIEFIFNGPFHWNRQTDSFGNVEVALDTGAAPPSSLGALHGSDMQHQSQSVSLSSFELNRRWSSDGLSSILSGLRIIDYREKFQLDAVKGANVGQLQIETGNLLVGGQLGINIGRPLSQRLTAVYGANTGLYGNFAEGSFRVSDASTVLADKSDSRFRLTCLTQLNAQLHYSISSGSTMFVGYDFWYFPGLSTVTDQRLGNVLSQDVFGLRTGEDQHFRGWSAGLSAKF